MTIEKWFFLLITAVTAYLFWSILKPFALVLLTAAVAAIILAPVAERLDKFLKHPRVSAAILSFGVIILIFIPMLLISLVMVRQASELLQHSLSPTGWIESLRTFLTPFLALLPNNVKEFLLSYNLNELGLTAVRWAFDNIGSVFSSATNVILNTFLFFVALYYLIVDRERLYSEVLALSPLKDSVDNKILKRVVGTVRSVVFGVLILSFVQGIFAAIGMSIFGVPGALIWGAVTIVAALVPVVGVALVLGPAVLYLFFTGSTVAAVGLLIWSVIVVGLADNVLGPYLIKGTTHMHSFLVLLAVLGGIQVFGYIGLIIGPTILAAFLALIELYQSGILTTGRLSSQ
jgi:predicted PurR-regulated permease PerM